MTKKRYRQVADLYVEGTEAELKDGSLLWAQALNPFEHGEAVKIAQAARARVVMAYQQFGSDEMVRVQAQIDELSKDRRIELISAVEAAKERQRIIGELTADDDWKEVINLLDRADMLGEGTEEEKALIDQKGREFFDEVNKRLDREEEFQVHKWTAAPDKEVVEFLKDYWLEMTAGDASVNEYNVAEMYFGVRLCDGVRGEDGEWDHSACGGHVDLFFEEPADPRSCPEKLWNVLREAFGRINMDPREAGNLDRLGSSSESLPQPSEQEDSEPSSPVEASSGAPGTSSSPSTTP